MNIIQRAEANIISAVFSDPALMSEIIEKTRFGYFSHPNDKILRAIYDIKNGTISDYKKISVLTVWKVLEKSGYEIDKNYISNLASRVVSNEDFHDSLFIVAENGIRSFVSSSLIFTGKISYSAQTQHHKTLKNKQLHN